MVPVSDANFQYTIRGKSETFYSFSELIIFNDISYIKGLVNDGLLNEFFISD